MRVPSGMIGTVIDVRVFTRDGVEKDARALEIEKAEIESLKKDLDDQFRIIEGNIYSRLSKLISGQKADGGPEKLKKGSAVTEEYLEKIGRE